MVVAVCHQGLISIESWSHYWQQQIPMYLSMLKAWSMQHPDIHLNMFSTDMTAFTIQQLRVPRGISVFFLEKHRWIMAKTQVSTKYDILWVKMENTTDRLVCCFFIQQVNIDSKLIGLAFMMSYVRVTTSTQKSLRCFSWETPMQDWDLTLRIKTYMASMFQISIRLIFLDF